MMPYEDPLRGIAINPRIVGGQQRRSHADIVHATNSYERDAFRGQPSCAVGRDEQKAVLQERYLRGMGGKSTGAPPKPRSQPPGSEAAGLHAQVSAEIAERQEFLTNMRSMGRGAEHEDAIHAQVAERMGELRKLEAMMREG